MWGVHERFAIVMGDAGALSILGRWVAQPIDAIARTGLRRIRFGGEAYVGLRGTGAPRFSRRRGHPE